MRIIFNLVRCNLANNGGSQSIIRMAMALEELGHNVSILLDQPNRFTWFGIPQKILHYMPKKLSKEKWPICDVMIATGCSTVESTLMYPHIPIKQKLYWIRGHETWTDSEENLFAKYKSGLTLLVNSEWLRDMIFTKCGISSHIQYPGLPIEEINTYRNKLQKTRKITDAKGVMGALYYTDKRTKRFDDVIEICSELNKKNMLSKLILFGNKPMMTSDYHLPIEFYLRPLMEEKVEIMSSCDIWLSTSTLEGLHIPPMEAGLCGCNIVARAASRSGVVDYAIDIITSKNFITVEEAVKCIRDYIYFPKIRRSNQANLKYILENKIGNVEQNAMKMIKLFESAL